MKKLLLFILPALFLFSCKKDDLKREKQNEDTSNRVWQYIKKLGFTDSEIKDIGDNYLVDGDILFPKNSNPDFSVFGGPATEQYSAANAVGFNIQPNITVRIDPSMNAFINEINGAIAIWNNVLNSRVRFTLTNATNQHILITNVNLGSGTCGAGVFPMNGLPGQTVQINGPLISANSFAQRQRTIAHELGHCIGFMHTNWMINGEQRSGQGPNGGYFSTQHVFGTPAWTDENSLMNGRECGIGATALSAFDIIALEFMYPANPRFPGTVPVFRYYSQRTSQDHFYTINWNELGNGNNNDYIFEGIAFYAFPSPAPGTVPVHYYYQLSSGDHFYTTDFSELGTGRSGYGYYGTPFHVYPNAINGARPVWRYYNGSAGDHFYTLNQDEFLLTGTGGWNFERLAFYAF